MKKLTIGMSTYDDFDGVYFSIQSLRMHQDLLDNDLDLLVIDNNPSSGHSKAIQGLCNWIPNLRYIPYDKKQSTSVRNEIFRNALGKYCISMDCHVMFMPDAINSLLKYYNDNPDCKNIVQGPMMYDNLKGYSTHFKQTWGADMYGQWDKNVEGYKSGLPFEIPMMGLGVFSCETKNWRWFNENFRGFGGEEGYIHEKFRLLGGKAICLPSFQWVHRFSRPNGVKYPLKLHDRVWNYILGWMELYNDPEHQMIQDIRKNFEGRFSSEVMDKMIEESKKLNKNIEYNTKSTITDELP
tara:strand:- start:1319 stop:2206 length:888 start_codon:yes stop_codon:yes gene_type:complete